MTDMPAFYPHALIQAVDQRINAGAMVHTVVLWTKHPASLFLAPLHPALLRWKEGGIQLAVQVTVTGFGGVWFKNAAGRQVMVEPNVPAMSETIALFPVLVALAGNPELITVRFDPVMKVASSPMAPESNLPFAPALVASMAAAGLKSLIYSFLEPGVYQKVDRRFRSAGLDIVGFEASEKTGISNYLNRLCAGNGIIARGCCVAGQAGTACLNGIALAELKGVGEWPDVRTLHRRPDCGCTKSTDLGGWPPKACYSGCLYCYASPIRR